MSVDASQVTALAHDFGLATYAIHTEARKVVFKGAMNVKRGWDRNVRSSAGRVASRYAGSIGFTLSDGDLTAEIEAQGGGAGFGAILEYGTATSPPHNDAKNALDAEAPKFERALERVAADVLK